MYTTVTGAVWLKLLVNNFWWKLFCESLWLLAFWLLAFWLC